MVAKPILLRPCTLKNILNQRKKRITEGTMSMYLLDMPQDRLLCKNCYVELKAGQKVYSPRVSSKSVRKYFCATCATRLNMKPSNGKR